MCTFDPNLGCAVGVKNVSGLVVLDKQTEQIYKVQPSLKTDYQYVAILHMSWEPWAVRVMMTMIPLTNTPKPISPLPSTSSESNSQ